MSFALQSHRVLVGRQIAKARQAKGMSHDALAAKTGTSRQHLIKLEKGQHLPRPEMLAKIAEATGKPESFFESEDDEESSAMDDSTVAADLLEVLLRVVTHARTRVSA